MKPLLVGQAPGPSSDPDHPLAPLPRSSAGGRLAELTGLTPAEYMRTFDRTNLLHTFPGRGSRQRGDKLPTRDARIAAAAMKPLLGGRHVILVGRNVAEAFGYPAQLLDFHQWFQDPKGFQVAVVPHTSGRNQWYKKEENLAAAREFWREVVRLHGGSAARIHPRLEKVG